MLAPALPHALPGKLRVAGFRVKLFVAIMLVVSAVTLLALFLAQRRLVASVEDELRRAFDGEIAALERAREIRHAVLVERCRALARRPRIRAAFEEDALDLLYDAAQYELQDVMAPSGLHAQFYRFLDPRGAVISPSVREPTGDLTAAEEEQLTLRELPAAPQIGYLTRERPASERKVSEIIAMPIVSFETGERIAAVVLGFAPFEMGRDGAGEGLRSGIWFDGELHGLALPQSAGPIVRAAVERAPGDPTRVMIDGESHLLFAQQLNPGSQYAPAYEVCVYPLAGLAARQRQLRWQVVGAGALLLLLGLAASHVASKRLSAPVEKLAIDSERAARFRPTRRTS